MDGATPPPQPRVFNHVPICGFDQVPVFDILNGPPEAAVSILVKPTISTAYKWVVIDGMVPDRALSYTDAYIMEHLNHLTAHRPNGWSDELARKAAIVLGVSRAVATTYYKITPAEMIPAETVASAMRFEEETSNADGTVTQPERMVVKGDVDAAVAARVTAPLALTDRENNVVAMLLLATIGTIPLQGFSLMNTGHHYISEGRSVSRRAFAAVEKQFFRSSDIGDWITQDQEVILDLMWHKSCHPVSMTIKERAACSEAVKEQLVSAGAGSAATRLPAAEAAVRGAEAYKTLFDTVRPIYEMFAGQLDSTIFDVAIAFTKALPPGVSNPTIPRDRDARIPPTVTNRRTAVQWVTQLTARNSAIAAQCFGFYCAMSDQGTVMGTAETSDSLRTAYSLKKLRQTDVASFTAGTVNYGDYMAARAKMRSKATYLAPIFKCN